MLKRTLSWQARCAHSRATLCASSIGANPTENSAMRALRWPGRVLRCDIGRLLDQETLSSLGNRSTCEWSVDSSAMLVSYDEAYDDYLTAPGRNITVVGG